MTKITMIDRMISQGQTELVNTSILPTDGLGGKEAELWKKIGVLLGNKVAGDPMFMNVTLPSGWSKRSTDHSMWTDLIDDKGRKRASIFYKAAFYDRSARISIARRFSISRDYDRKDVILMRVKDGDVVRFTGNEYSLLDEKGVYISYDQQDVAEKFAIDECCTWLVDNRFPNYGDPTAYWD